MKQPRALALIVKWRQAANEATDPESVATYLDCAADLETALAAHVLMAVCEGCGTEIPMPTRHARQVQADLPAGWSQCGVSKHRVMGHAPGLAAWCPSCRAHRKPAPPSDRQER